MAIESQSNVKKNPDEGKMTRTVEDQTARIPSLGYLGFAAASMVASASLAFVFRRRDLANFIGLWAPSILIIGVYNKLVKLEREQRQAAPITSDTRSIAA